MLDGIVLEQIRYLVVADSSVIIALHIVFCAPILWSLIVIKNFVIKN